MKSKENIHNLVNGHFTLMLILIKEAGTDTSFFILRLTIAMYNSHHYVSGVQNP